MNNMFPHLKDEFILRIGPVSYVYALTEQKHFMLNRDAAEMDLKFDNHNIGTLNSWFQPVIIRNVPNRNYAWTCVGDVYYSDGKKPSLYWDSGALLWYMPTHLCAISKKPYIRGAKIRLIWAYIDPTERSLDMEKFNASSIHEQTYQFGDVNNS
jgi:hypothetical protein